MKQIEPNSVKICLKSFIYIFADEIKASNVLNKRNLHTMSGKLFVEKKELTLFIKKLH